MNEKLMLALSALVLLAACSTVPERPFALYDDFRYYGIAPAWFTQPWELTK
jgi:uncharacterized lipoprotein